MRLDDVEVFDILRLFIFLRFDESCDFFNRKIVVIIGRKGESNG